MSKYNINEMNLYKTTNRFLKSFIQLKKSLNRLPTILELSAIDHLHYNGADAVEYAIKTIGQVVSGELREKTFDIGAFSRFKT